MLSLDFRTISNNLHFAGDSAAEDDSDSEMEESVPPSTDDLQAAPMDDSTNAEVPDYRRYNQKPGDFSFLQDFFV